MLLWILRTVPLFLSRMLPYFDTLSPEDAEILAWRFLLAAYDAVSAQDGDALQASGTGVDLPNACYLTISEQNEPVVLQQENDDKACLWQSPEGVWCRSSHIPAIAAALFDLYLPLLSHGAASYHVIAHMGQSVDSRIATSSGDGFFVTGEENRRHMHCLRALSDAVVVGAATIVADNPQLTTRAVSGEHPVRVVLDARAELSQSYGVFDDAQSRTLLLHQSSAKLDQLPMTFGPRLSCGTQQVQRCIIPDSDTGMAPEQVAQFLASQGLRRLFIEGGGVTVSRFLESGVLDRLHVAVAPLLVGEGIPALQLGGVDKMMNAHRPPFAMYAMGEDVLWDFDVSAIPPAGVTAHTQVNQDAQHSQDSQDGQSKYTPVPLVRIR